MLNVVLVFHVPLVKMAIMLLLEQISNVFLFFHVLAVKMAVMLYLEHISNVVLCLVVSGPPPDGGVQRPLPTLPPLLLQALCHARQVHPPGVCLGHPGATVILMIPLFLVAIIL